MRIVCTMVLFMHFVPVFGQDTLKTKAESLNPHGPIRLNCETCHTTINWKTLSPSMAFDHNRETGFPLLGLHKSVTCRTCHDNLAFVMARTDCHQCHQDVHKGQLGQNCGHCHHPSSWKPGSFVSQHAATRFPLTGRHATTDCRSCHVNQRENEYAGIPTDCFFCHAADYQRTSNPNHAMSGLSTDCQNCHTTLAWTPANADHALFGFVLDGAHKSAACALCHANSDYRSASRECVTCHRSDYDAALQPNHAQGGFPTECQACHSTKPGWRPASFDHNATRFALTGAHKRIESQCSQCHAGGFSGTPTDCFACHTADYTQATNPIHTNVFPTTCVECHSTNAWTPSTFDHGPSFPITSGKHRGKWNGCATAGDGSGCHNVPTNYQLFSCTHCHDHSQSRMNGEHDEVRDYVYQSQACFDCHPRGEE